MTMLTKAATKRLEDGIGQVRDVRALLADYKAAVQALHEIAAWREGDSVTSGFDEPGSAGTARQALAGMGIKGPQ